MPYVYDTLGLKLLKCFRFSIAWEAMIVTTTTDTQEETKLNSFDYATRVQALRALLNEHPDAPHVSDVANMHCHTFFSFNAYGYSPTALAWLARQRGYALLGIVDFDVLDAVTEFLDACELVGVRGSAGIETRTFVPEYAEYEINSPGEPGVCYHMGIGFSATQVPAAAAQGLSALRAQAAQRNRELVARVNAYLTPLTIDYDRDVLPLTPAGNATERHIVLAYLRAAAQRVDNLAAFWSARLDLPLATVEGMLPESPALQNSVRSRLMKKGGAGYVQPDAGAFPPVEKINALTVMCGGLPCAAWLDGTTNGEQRYAELLALLVAKGAVALNIVPDRNWNISDPAQARLKQENLHAVVALAREMDLPLNIGTEMNSFGQPTVDDFDAAPMAPLRQTFMDGAYFIYGHTVLARHLAMGYQSAWAVDQLPTRAQRNVFYAAVGRAVSPGAAGSDLLANVHGDMAPDEVLRLLA